MDPIEWHLRFVKRLVEAGLAIEEANDILIAGAGSYDYEQGDPEDEADAELSYRASDG